MPIEPPAACAEPGLEYRKRWCIDVLQAQTPQLLARCMLVLYDAIRPSVAKQLLSSRWSYMDTEIVPGGVAVLDAVRPPLATPTHLLAALAQRRQRQWLAECGGL